MIPEIKTILYASDLGEGSREASRYATAEALKHGAQIVYLNIVEPANDATEALLESSMEEGSVQEMRKSGIDKLKQLMEERIRIFIKEEKSIDLPQVKKPIIRVEEGHPAETIIQVAEELDADLIVMGTRTRTHSALGRFFVGSAAQSVMQLTDRPVMIVPLKD